MLKTLVLASVLTGAPGAACAAPAGDKDNEIVITASPLADSRFATGVQNVSRDDILTKGGASLAGALSEVAGVSATGFAAGASRPVIRGMDATRVKLLEDGVSSSDVSDIGPDHGVPIDPLSAQKIEVVRGAATLRYGSQAIGGVVNAINNRIPRTAPGEPFGGEVSFAADSAAHAREGAALFDGRIGRLALHADGFTRHTDDYDTPLGVQANSFFQGNGYSLGSSYFLANEDRVGAALIHYDARYGIPGDTTFIDMRQTKGLASSTIHIDRGAVRTLNLDAGYGDYRHDEKDPDGAVRSSFTNQEADTRGELLFGPLGLFSSSALGLQATDRQFSAGGEGGDYLSPTRSTSAAAFVFAEAPLGARAHLQGAARAERAQIDGTPASTIDTMRTFAPLSVSFGVLWDASAQIKLALTLASAARTPAPSELFARGPHDGPGTFEIGDPALGLERANSLEGTLRVSAARGRVDASLWGAHFTNYIYGRLTGETCDVSGVCFADNTHELKQLFYAAADAHFWGAEAKASYALFKLAGGQVEADGLTDMVRAVFVQGGPVPRIQPWRAGAGLGWKTDLVEAGFLFMQVGAQDRTPPGDTPTRSYRSLSAHASWRPFGEARGLTLALSGENLTNDVQRNAVALNRNQVAMPGANFRLVLRQTF